MALAAQAKSSFFSFSESWADKLLKVSEDGETYYEVTSSGKFATRGAATISNDDSETISDLNEDTSVSIQIGDWSADAVLGDDPRFVPGQSKSVRLPLPNGGVVKIAWTQRALTWSVTAKTGTARNGDELEASPLASGLATGETYRITPDDGITATCNLTFEGINIVYSEIPVTGSVKHKVKRLGSGDFAEELDLNAAKIKAKAIFRRD